MSSFTDLASDRHRGNIESDVEISLLAVGGAAVAAGIVGIVLNAPYAVTEHAIVAPTRGGAIGGATWRF